MTKSTVDNSSDGNCMYYSYGISLMYFLRDKKDNKLTETAFNNLNLNAQQKESLNTLLKKNQDFSKKDIKEIIEPILGTATRLLGAERTRQEFLDKPSDSPIFAAATHGIEYAFKQQLMAKKSPLAEYINNNFDNADYIEAELYNKALDMPKGMQDFAKRQIDDFLVEFERRWEVKRKTLKEPLSAGDSDFYRSQVLDTMIGEKTTEFFIENNNHYLNKYIARLNTNYVWGSEETMFALHRAVTGEKMERNPETTLIETTYDAEIPLILYQNGARAVANTSDAIPDPSMILNNIGNVHWVSLVQLNKNDLTLSARQTQGSNSQEHTLPPVSNTDGAKSDDELALVLANSLKDSTNQQKKEDDDLESALANSLSDSGSSDKEEDDLSLALANSLIDEEDIQVPNEQEEDYSQPSLTNSSTATTGTTAPNNQSKTSSSLPQVENTAATENELREEQELRKNIMYLTGFTFYLDALKEKAEKLKNDGYPNESKLAHKLVKDLRTGMNNFIENGTAQSREADKQAFVDHCTPLINGALDSKLAEHRGIKGVLNAVLNFVASVCTLGLINWNLGKLTIVEPFTTKSAEAINEIQTSVNVVSQYKETFFSGRKSQAPDDAPTSEDDYGNQSHFTHR